MNLKERIRKAVAAPLDLFGAWSSAAGQSQPGTMDMSGRPASSLPAPAIDGPAFNTQDFPPPGVPFAPYYRGVAPRAFDFPASVNLNRQPRAEEENSFALLRKLANINDVVQYCIRAKTDELTAADWTFLPRPGYSADDPLVKEAIRQGMKFWERPNRMDNLWFDQWITQILYDVFVTDSLTIFPQLDRTGAVHSFVQVDGTTIKVLIDNFGHTPRPPFPAYQQVIHGIIRGEYTSDEMLYRPTNPQIDSVYGRSIVEMCLLHVVTGIRRWTFNLAYYTDGALPQMFIQVPDVSPENVQAWMEILNETLAGNDQARWRFVPLPKDANPIAVKDPVWTKEQDEWIARVICSLFSVNPLPFVSMMNRSTAEVAENLQTDLGLRPLKRTLSTIITDLEERRTGNDLVRFSWIENKTEISKERSDVMKFFMDEGLMRRSYVREEMLGLPPDPELDSIPLGPLGGGGGGFSPGVASADGAEIAGTKTAIPESDLPKIDFGPFSKAVSNELSTWRRVAKKYGPQHPKAQGFESESLPVALLREMRLALSGAKPEQVDSVFEAAKNDPKMIRLSKTEKELEQSIQRYLDGVAPFEIARAIGRG